MRIYIYIFFFVSFRSGRTDCHQSLDAVLEEDNRTCKVWVWGEPDADVWRSVVRNHDALMMFREKTLDVMALVDPKSESRARVRPSYDKELIVCRAQLRPFLTSPDGNVANTRPLESLSGASLNQDAVHLLAVGEQWRSKLYQEHLQLGFLPDHRKNEAPLDILKGKESSSAQDIIDT